MTTRSLPQRILAVLTPQEGEQAPTLRTEQILDALNAPLVDAEKPFNTKDLRPRLSELKRKGKIEKVATDAKTQKGYALSGWRLVTPSGDV